MSIWATRLLFLQLLSTWQFRHTFFSPTFAVSRIFHSEDTTPLLQWQNADLESWLSTDLWIYWACSSMHIRPRGRAAKCARDLRRCPRFQALKFFPRSGVRTDSAVRLFYFLPRFLRSFPGFLELAYYSGIDSCLGFFTFPGLDNYRFSVKVLSKINRFRLEMR